MGSKFGRTFLACVLIAAVPLSADWTHWRGEMRNGTSPETGLISSWSHEGENLLWEVGFTGRATPLVLGDRVCVNGRVGEGIDRQEVAACYNVETGEKLWERRLNVYNTTVPWTRAGWPNPAIDPETGFFYLQGVGGNFYCIDSADGSMVWWRNFMEEFGFMEGYGGRTQTPLIDGDRIVVTFSSAGWGSTLPPRHRLFSFDKKTGELMWVSTPGTTLRDKNTQSTPAAVTVDGTRLLIHGNGDGHVYAVKAENGEKVWGFHLSQRGINTSAVVDGNKVYFAHSQENIDGGAMGRLVAIDITGTGDVTRTHEVWRQEAGTGFSSPALYQGKLYYLDPSANLHVVDAETGTHLSELNIGRVGKASPVIADGKLYVTEVNGRMVIVDVSGEEPTILHSEKIRTGRRWAETYGSVAISDGRIFFTNEATLYAIGQPRAHEATTPVYTTAPAQSGGEAATMRVSPAETIIRPGQETRFVAQLFNEHGAALKTSAATWSLEGISGSISASGQLTPDFSGGADAGMVTATVDGMTAKARVRVIPDLPFSEDYESIAIDAKPSYQVGYLMSFKVEAMDGDRVLAKNPSPRMIHRHISFIGAPDQSDYTITGDLMASANEEKRPDIGLINSGYTLELMGEHQLLELRSWPSARRMYTSTPFPWEPETWYRARFEVRSDDKEATLRGKVWPRDQQEPEAWSIETTDPHPIPAGSPGLSGYSPTSIYFDNIEVTKNP